VQSRECILPLQAPPNLHLTSTFNNIKLSRHSKSVTKNKPSDLLIVWSTFTECHNPNMIRTAVHCTARCRCETHQQCSGTKSACRHWISPLSAQSALYSPLPSHHTTRHYTTMHYTALHCTTLQCTSLHLPLSLRANSWRIWQHALINYMKASNAHTHTHTHTLAAVNNNRKASRNGFSNPQEAMRAACPY
jgi:hypothetical protein